MLVLTRRVAESVVIGGDIVVSVLDIGHDRVKLGIEAPQEVPVLRHELCEAVRLENLEAAKLPSRRLRSVVHSLRRNLPSGVA